MANHDLPFVYIVESPSPRDLSDGRTEGRSLCETFKLSNTRHDYFLAVNEEQFVRAFDLSDEASPLRQSISRLGTPIVHLSMHGNDQGICLTDGTMIDWEYLLAILTPLNNGLEWGVFVTLSTCGGAAAARMSMYTEEHRKPLYATLGSTESIPWDDALVAYTVFYHNLFKLKLPATCVELMRAASGHNSFQFYGGAEQKKAFIEFVNKQRLIEALTRD